MTWREIFRSGFGGLGDWGDLGDSGGSSGVPIPFIRTREDSLFFFRFHSQDYSYKIAA